LKIKLVFIGKTTDKCLLELIQKYQNRIKKFITFEIEEISALKNVKNLSVEQIKDKEASLFLKKIEENSFVIMLDEKGKVFTSKDFAFFLQKKMNIGFKNIYFFIGGAYGFSSELYQKADLKLSLSSMTFSHQLIRVIFLEQLYRAFTILNNHPYHNE